MIQQSYLISGDDIAHTAIPAFQATSNNPAGRLVSDDPVSIFNAFKSIPETVWSVYKYTPFGILIDTFKNMSSGEFVQYAQQHPEVIQQIKDKINSVGGYLFSPIKSTFTIVNMLPYLLIAAAVIAGIYVVKM